MNNYSIGPKQYLAYGMGNFASQMSWTMVSSYLTIFYTDVFGLAAGAVSVLFLIARIWDGCTDVMMGEIMEHTRSRWGRFRPYITAGAPLLVLFTILTFSVPGFGNTGKLIYAYVTYIGLGMVYTVTNVPYTALPAVMTQEPKKINRLFTAQMMGMVIGMIVLNLCTLPLVNYFDGIKAQGGYQITATMYAVIALPMFWFCAKQCKEVIKVTKEAQASVKDSLASILTSRDAMCVIIYSLLNMAGMLGRIGVATYFYIYVVGNFQMVTIFMMLPMFVGAFIMPFCPKVIEKIGRKKTLYIALGLQVAGCLMMFFGTTDNMVYLVLAHVVYGGGYIGGPCGSAMMADAIEDIHKRKGVRPDGTAYAVNGLANKVGQAIGSALGIAIIGWFGYVAGQDITPHVTQGIQIGVNLMPAVVYAIAFIPVALFSLEGKKKDEAAA